MITFLKKKINPVFEAPKQPNKSTSLNPCISLYSLLTVLLKWAQNFPKQNLLCAFHCVRFPSSYSERLVLLLNLSVFPALQSKHLCSPVASDSLTYLHGASVFFLSLIAPISGLTLCLLSSRCGWMDLLTTEVTPWVWVASLKSLQPHQQKESGSSATSCLLLLLSACPAMDCLLSTLPHHPASESAKCGLKPLLKLQTPSYNKALLLVWCLDVGYFCLSNKKSETVA